MKIEEKCKPVDLKLAKKLLGVNKELYETLIEIFTEEADDQIEEIGKSIVDQNSEGLDHAAHKFKSSLSSLGTIFASDIAEQLEFLGKGSEIKGSVELFEKLKKEYAVVHDYFESGQWTIDWEKIT